eukprot:7421441-Karenia_brevis.AAC.1
MEQEVDCYCSTLCVGCGNCSPGILNGGRACESFQYHYAEPLLLAYAPPANSWLFRYRISVGMPHGQQVDTILKCSRDA